MGSRPKPEDRQRALRRLSSTPAARKLYEYFVRPFIDRLHMRDDQSAFTDGVEYFFGVDERPITLCKAKESFRMPGNMWSSPSQPHKLINGVGDRNVPAGAALYVRQDIRRPDKNEIEFKDQVFVLTEGQYRSIKNYLKPIA